MDGYGQEPLTKESSEVLWYLWQLLILDLQQIKPHSNPASANSAVFITCFSSICLHSSFLPSQQAIRSRTLWLEVLSGRDPANSA